MTQAKKTKPEPATAAKPTEGAKTPPPQEQAPPGPPPEDKRPKETEEQRVSRLKIECSDKITTELLKPESIARCTSFLSKAANDQLAIAEINDYVGRLKTYILNDEGVKDFQKVPHYICECSIGSIMRVFFECLQVHLPIDRRGLVYVYNNKNVAEMKISYKGYIHRINELYNNPDLKVDLVFEGDTFEYWSESGDDFYKYHPGPNRTTRDPLKVVWAYAYYRYSVGGRLCSKLELIDKAELELIRSKSKMKTGGVWGEWTNEMYKKSVVRRACKLPFISADNDDGMLDLIDNESYDMKRLPAPSRALLLENQLTAEAERRKNAKKPPVEPEKPEVGAGVDAGKTDKGPVSPATVEGVSAPDEGSKRDAGKAGTASPVPVGGHGAVPQEVLPPTSKTSGPAETAMPEELDPEPVANMEFDNE